MLKRRHFKGGLLSQVSKYEVKCRDEDGRLLCILKNKAQSKMEHGTLEKQQESWHAGQQK